ncbi:ABC transporter ATP-binding protein [Parafrankia sp. Ea1.12]|uniref:ABC transporter ATP-binding protein n=1 Tax=unclassified Parafrankia TaxID=2994368 RepID=UPI000DD3755F|nr:ABC transporter ATP-binding protein [Parafrankia sp. BMG5.11]
MDAAPVLRCEGLVRRFCERTAVDDVSFSIAPGETYGLLGPNGAGKTTAISIIAGVLAADSGSVVVAGHPMRTDAGRARGAIGLVPQELALYPDLTIRENLRFFGRLQRMPRRHLARRIDEVLEVVGLADRARDRVDVCSGGMKRRVNIAVGLLHEPRLLILDEPTVGVDPQSRHQILASVETLGGAGLAVLYTTHYMEEAERLCDRLGIIDAGRIVAEGTRRELVERIGEHDRVVVTATGPTAGFAAAAGELPGVHAARPVDGGLEVLADSASALLAPLVTTGEHLGVTIAGIEVVEPDLEAVFLHLTGRALRD